MGQVPLTKAALCSRAQLLGLQAVPAGLLKPKAVMWARGRHQWVYLD